jgi:pimeloyl-ACP methyl ester carboxylesterase
MTTTCISGNTLSINGFDMYYQIHGEGYPLLLLHGFTGSGTGLVKEFNQLSSNYQLIIPDLRGHGRSTNPSKKFTFRQVALDIFARTS